MVGINIFGNIIYVHVHNVLHVITFNVFYKQHFYYNGFIQQASCYNLIFTSFSYLSKESSFGCISFCLIFLLAYIFFLFVYVSCLPICGPSSPSVYLPVSLPACLPICLHACLNGQLLYPWTGTYNIC